MATKLKSLSVFFPCYNEEKNIELLVNTALKVIPDVADSFEVILVNDGSTDNTRQVAEKAAGENACVRVVNQENMGYGGAVKRGFAESRYEWVFFSDGDLQFDLSEISEFVAYTDDYDLIIGYRKKRAEGWKRTLIAKLLRAWNMVFLGFPLFVKDIDCAFKLIRKDVLNNIGVLQSDGAMMTTELLLKAYRANYRFKQIGVSHYPRKFGKQTGDNVKVIKRAIRDTFLLRKLLRGRVAPRTP
ncbi:MAG: glycosyltransferase family 2 protein [Patescibacteria group bacterium]|jgi:glycosyltransferase involved in cell wall biosynthesis